MTPFEPSTWVSQIPVFIVSFNRLECLQALITWLEKAGMQRIIILDNASTYPPLLAYYETLPHEVVRLEQNLGHLALYRCGLFDDLIANNYYILTDPDVVPTEACPLDALERFHAFLERNSEFTKIGFSLKLDDLPDAYEAKVAVLAWEAQFYRPSLQASFQGIPIYNASIDTTFALYRPSVLPEKKAWWRAVRTGQPYEARHLGWYGDSQHPTDEETYYREQALANVTSWTNTADSQKRYKKKASWLRPLLQFVKNYALAPLRPRFWQGLHFQYKKRLNRF